MLKIAQKTGINPKKKNEIITRAIEKHIGEKLNLLVSGKEYFPRNSKSIQIISSSIRTTDRDNLFNIQRKVLLMNILSVLTSSEEYGKILRLMM